MGSTLCCEQEDEPLLGESRLIVETLPLVHNARSSCPNLLTVVVPEDIDFLGIVPTALPPSPVTLRYIEAGSWAEQNGISIGDELLELNDRSVREFSVIEFNDALKRKRPLKMLFAECVGAFKVPPPTDEEKRGLRRASTKELLEWHETSGEVGTSELQGKAEDGRGDADCQLTSNGVDLSEKQTKSHEGQQIVNEHEQNVQCEAQRVFGDNMSPKAEALLPGKAKGCEVSVDKDLVESPIDKQAQKYNLSSKFNHHRLFTGLEKRGAAFGGA